MRSPLLISILATIGCAPTEEGEACLAMEADATECPAPEDVNVEDLVSPDQCDLDPVEMLSTEAPDIRENRIFQDGTLACCYDTLLVDTMPGGECQVGRPFLHEGAPVLPAAPEVGEPVAAAWLRLARLELASVAAFARLQLELLAHGAPLDLVDRVAAAMADEVDHARRARAHAERLAGVALPFGPMPLPAIDVQRGLAALARDAVREGCIGETVSAGIVRAAAEAAEDPAWADELAAVAADEERHAVLSWSIVAWAVRAGGAEVRVAVRAAFAAPVPVGGMTRLDGAAPARSTTPSRRCRSARRPFV